MPAVGETCSSPEAKHIKLDLPSEGEGQIERKDDLKSKISDVNESAPTLSTEEKACETTTTKEPDVKMQFSKLSENAYTPTRGSELAAGFDLYSAYEYTVPSKGKVIAKTDIQIALPPGCYGRIAPRSGLAHKHFIDIGAGVIDQDYRGNVGVILFNFSELDFEVKKGDRIAQLILERIFIPKLEELKTLDETERGTGGFGSTGSS